jgi:Caspase domain
VGDRRAFLIGIEDYGEGFAPLPAVGEDVRLVGAALEAAGFETALCPPEVMANASKLDAAMREFCGGGGPDDVRLIYFTGHGILADSADWVIPAGVKRKDAAASPNQRVSTDLSTTVADSTTGLVLFVIDACRDPADSADTARIARPGEDRFIRLFGCAANEICQVVPATDSAAASSLFARSFAECIAEGDSVSLEELLPKVEARYEALLAENPSLRPQAPRLSVGEQSAETRKNLKKTIFDLIRPSALATVWTEFDPNKLQFLVVTSEYEQKKSPDWGLVELVKDAVAGETGRRIWSAFCAAAGNLQLVSGRRSPPAAFKPSAVCMGVFSVLDAFASGKALDTAIRAVAEADVVVFDITGFEPGVMLLVGVRSACRRWLSVCSHGAGWKEGLPLDLPFNLQDLNISSHSPRDSLVGPDPRVKRFAKRVETGFVQASKQPHYLDLPAYDALRQLGSHYTASSTIGPSERILVLCAYAAQNPSGEFARPAPTPTDRMFENWQFVSSQLKQVLSQKKELEPAIERIIDYETTELIRHSVYEQIRRTAACVVDWSEFSASVFLELGARLAVSEWGAIQIIDDRYLPGGKDASKLTQVERMRRLLGPMPYKSGAKSSNDFEHIADALLQRNPSLDGDADYNRFHRSLLAAIGKVQAAQPPVVEELKRRADALHDPQQGRVGAPQILFHGSRPAKQDSERAALERRIAAWLYLEHRVGLAKLKEDGELLKTYRELGQSAIDALYDLGDDASFALASFIEKSLAKD